VLFSALLCYAVLYCAVLCDVILCLVVSMSLHSLTHSLTHSLDGCTDNKRHHYRILSLSGRSASLRCLAADWWVCITRGTETGLLELGSELLVRLAWYPGWWMGGLPRTPECSPTCTLTHSSQTRLMSPPSRDTISTKKEVRTCTCLVVIVSWRWLVGVVVLTGGVVVMTMKLVRDRQDGAATSRKNLF
jgi:hypothetical protein